MRVTRALSASAPGAQTPPRQRETRVIRLTFIRRPVSERNAGALRKQFRRPRGADLVPGGESGAGLRAGCRAPDHERRTRSAQAAGGTGTRLRGRHGEQARGAGTACRERHARRRGELQRPGGHRRELGPPAGVVSSARSGDLDVRGGRSGLSWSTWIVCRDRRCGPRAGESGSWNTCRERHCGWTGRAGAGFALAGRTARRPGAARLSQVAARSGSRRELGCRAAQRAAARRGARVGPKVAIACGSRESPSARSRRASAPSRRGCPPDLVGFQIVAGQRPSSAEPPEPPVAGAAKNFWRVRFGCLLQGETAPTCAVLIRPDGRPEAT